MSEGLLLPRQQIYHLVFLFSFLEKLSKFLVNFTLLKFVKSQRNYGLLITKELIFGFQILDLKDHFSASLITLSAKSHEKHLVIEQLPWCRNQSYSINFMPPETFKCASVGCALKQGQHLRIV